MKKLLFLLAFLVFACTVEETTSDITITTTDTIAPIIKLTGDNTQILYLNENYTELGATATDETDGDITNQITITANIDTSKEDSYIVIYSVSDKAGNITTITREIIIKGSNPIYLDSNGITVKAYDWATVGTSGRINGKKYTIVDRVKLKSMIDNNEDVSLVCTSKITDMSFIMAGTDHFNPDISSWDTSNVTNMNKMFRNAIYFNQDISNWNVSNVTDMSYMFSSAENFNQNIGNWDVSNVTTMDWMFSYAFKFNQNTGNWDVSNVTTMNSMFAYAYKFNQNIGNWDVSNVTDMEGMFYAATSFNQNLSGWCVTNVIFENYQSYSYFASNAPLDMYYYPLWGTCPN